MSARHVHFDLAKRIATVPLYYKTPDDLLDEHLSRPGKPVISDAAIDYLLDIIKDIPKEFTVNISLTVNDYGEYDHQQLLKAIQTTVENTYYYYDENRRKDIVLSVLFIIIGGQDQIRLPENAFKNAAPRAEPAGVYTLSGRYSGKICHESGGKGHRYLLDL